MWWDTSVILALWKKKQEDLLQVQGQVGYKLILSQTNKNPTKQINKYKKKNDRNLSQEIKVN